ncbi:outer membrane lipoprotein [Legionella massiliensis]|uniref:Outer membrane lipoprotein n=1 Tax=Legionella massiliensis TaxID=1034943 RepID=A0A078KWR3_9GAMM|nr:BON domain-containing protein [Legionella massiliensis]CDZ76178.1 outer membrane lipoprotein [Legionella massiliensis]CEE11916.1 outer membrane lipoprotein [Legionella massiliensis]
MIKQGRLVVILLIGSWLQLGCLSSLWTGASLFYDRHNVYKQVDDFQLATKANRAIYKNNDFKERNCSIEIAVFNGDILLTGYASTLELRQEAVQRISALKGYRRIINQIDISSKPDNNVEDSWITAKIRSQIIADSAIDPHAFKVITSDRIVYLMGDVRPHQATRVINIARNTEGVERVVKLFKYFNLSEIAETDT